MPDRAFLRVGLLALVDIVGQIVIRLVEESFIVRIVICFVRLRLTFEVKIRSVAQFLIVNRLIQKLVDLVDIKTRRDFTKRVNLNIETFEFFMNAWLIVFVRIRFLLCHECSIEIQTYKVFETL
jgi:hypothetical protein